MGFFNVYFKNFIPCVLLNMPFQIIFTIISFLRKDHKNSKIEYTGFTTPEASDEILFNLNIVTSY